MADLLGEMMSWEAGNLAPAEEIDLFQRLVDSGLAWQLQGTYGRTAQALIDAGYVQPVPNNVSAVEADLIARSNEYKRTHGSRQ